MDALLAFGMALTMVFFFLMKFLVFLLNMTIENQQCRKMLLKDHNSPLGMDYIEIKRRSNFTRKILLVAGVTALFVFMLKRPAGISGSTKVPL